MNPKKANGVKALIHYYRMRDRAVAAGYSDSASGVENWIKDLRRKRWWDNMTEDQRQIMLNPPQLFISYRL